MFLVVQLTKTPHPHALRASKLTRTSLFVVTSLVCVVALWFVVNRDANFKAPLALMETSVMDGVVIEQKKAGQIQWRLSAKTAYHMSNDDVMLSDVSISMPEKDLVLKTDKVLYSLSKRDFSVPGEVKVHSKDYDIVGSRLHWDASRSILTAERDIRIVSQGFVLEGDGLTATTDRATLNKNVRATFYGK